MMVAAVYFGYLAIAAWFSAVPRRRQLSVSAGAVFSLLIAWSAGGGHVMPLAYLLAGYWLPGRMVGAPHAALERRLVAFDHRMFGPGGLARSAERTPRWVLEYLELAYLSCYLVLPAGAAVLVFGAGQSALDHYWTTVLVASFCCYGVLPWLPSRAPRFVEPEIEYRSAVRTVNLALLSRASVQWNTFPSGHTAASFAVALAVWPSVPVAGALLTVVAASIAVGSVVGRYHYAADVITGAIVAGAAFVTATAVRGW